MESTLQVKVVKNNEQRFQERRQPQKRSRHQVAGEDLKEATPEQDCRRKELTLYQKWDTEPARKQEESILQVMKKYLSTTLMNWKRLIQKLKQHELVEKSADEKRQTILDKADDEDIHVLNRGDHK